MNGATAANGIPSSPLNISASKTIEPVAKTTKMNVPTNSTVKICKLEYVIIFHYLLILSNSKLLILFDHEFF